MNRIVPVLALLVASSALAACASEPRPAEERGWIGGHFAAVTRGHVSEITSGLHGALEGMPTSASGESAALVTDAHAGTPLARAGLVPGDLLLTLDGMPADDELDLRERVESMKPGARVPVAYWRDGETRTADVVVGRETYRRSGSVTIGIGISSALDLWPFDDGIDILGLIRLRWDHDRNDVTGVVPDYVRKVRPGESVEGPMQEKVETFLLLVGAAKGKTVLSQETLP